MLLGFSSTYQCCPLALPFFCTLYLVSYSTPTVVQLQACCFYFGCSLCKLRHEYTTILSHSLTLRHKIQICWRRRNTIETQKKHRKKKKIQISPNNETEKNNGRNKINVIQNAHLSQNPWIICSLILQLSFTVPLSSGEEKESVRERHTVKRIQLSSIDFKCFNHNYNSNHND